MQLCSPPQIQRVELYEALMRDHKAQLLMGKHELVSTLSRLLGLPALTTLLMADDWHHRDPAEPCEPPSLNPTFQAVARCIQAGTRDQWDELESAVGYRGNTQRGNWTNGCAPERHGQYWSRPRGIVSTV